MIDFDTWMKQAYPEVTDEEYYSSFEKMDGKAQTYYDEYMEDLAKSNK